MKPVNDAVIVLLRANVEQRFIPARLLLQTIEQAGDLASVRVISNAPAWPQKEYGITSYTLTTEHRYYKPEDVQAILEYFAK
jgi:hypothetical protein